MFLYNAQSLLPPGSGKTAKGPVLKFFKILAIDRCGFLVCESFLGVIVASGAAQETGSSHDVMKCLVVWVERLIRVTG